MGNIHFNWTFRLLLKNETKNKKKDLFFQGEGSGVGGNRQNGNSNTDCNQGPLSGKPQQL